MTATVQDVQDGRTPASRGAWRHSRWLAAGLAAAVVIVTCFVYAPVRNHGFIAFDDPDYVTDNPFVQRGLTWAGVRWAFTTGHASNWHPLTWLSHMVDVELFGPGPRGPHLMNVLLHAANAALLLLLLRRGTGSVWRSTFVAALFALHPLRLESVAWISERKDLLCGLFFLASLYTYVRAHGAGRGVAALQPGRDSPFEVQSSKFKGLRRTCSLLLFACALLSKPMAVTLPFVLLLLDFWPLGRWSRCWSWTGIRALLVEKLPYFALSAAASVVTYLVQQQGGAVRSLAQFSFGERMMNAIVGYVRYVGLTLWPQDLAIFYPHPGAWPALTVLGAVVVLGGLAAVTLRGMHRVPAAVAGVVWFLGTMVPTIGVVQVGEHSIADRYTYLPTIGLLIAIAWAAGDAVARWRRLRWPATFAAVMVVMLAAYGTARGLRYWRDSETLFRRALEVTRGNYVAHNSVGRALLDAGRLEEAIVQFEAAIALRRGFAEAHNNLGTAWLRKGHLDRAAAEFNRAIEALPVYALPWYNLGTLRLQGGDVSAAIGHLERAAQLRPDDALTHLNLGNARLQQGRLDAAAVEYQKTLALRPDDADAHGNLGNVYLQQGKVDLAGRHLERAVELQPDQANAHFFLGELALRAGRRERAVGQFGRAVALQPGDADARQRLAVLLLDLGRSRQALEHFEALLQLQPENPAIPAAMAWILATAPDGAVRDGARALPLARRAMEMTQAAEPLALRSVAAAHAELGQFAEAVTFAERAFQLVASRGDGPLHAQLSEQLARYRAGTPYYDAGRP